MQFIDQNSNTIKVIEVGNNERIDLDPTTYTLKLGDHDLGEKLMQLGVVYTMIINEKNGVLKFIRFNNILCLANSWAQR